MNRGINKQESIRLIETIREKNPDIRLRTTMIAGYPGETRDEFEELLEFVEATRFDRLGCFPYCHEEYAPSFTLEDSVSAEEKQDRVAELMELQEAISQEKNRKFEEKEIIVLIDQVEEGMAFGRTEYDAPEVDNECMIETGDFDIQPGIFCRARITDSTPFDLEGKVIGLG